MHTLVTLPILYRREREKEKEREGQKGREGERKRGRKAERERGSESMFMKYHSELIKKCNLDVFY